MGVAAAVTPNTTTSCSLSCSKEHSIHIPFPSLFLIYISHFHKGHVSKQSSVICTQTLLFLNLFILFIKDKWLIIKSNFILVSKLVSSFHYAGIEKVKRFKVKKVWHSDFHWTFNAGSAISRSDNATLLFTSDDIISRKNTISSFLFQTHNNKVAELTPEAHIRERVSDRERERELCGMCDMGMLGSGTPAVHCRGKRLLHVLCNSLGAIF